MRPAILHAHDYKTNVMSELLGRWHKARVMTTVHGYVTLSPRLNAYYRIDRWALRRMDHVVAVSDDLRSQVVGWGVAAERCTMVQNAIDSQQFRRASSPAEMKSRLGFSPERMLIGAVGRLSAEKAFDQLITAVDRLIREGHNVDLAIVGNGDERSRLQSQIDRLGHGDRIHLLGYRSETIELYQAMDVFVLSSLREALPNVVLEALSMETPVVATRIAGVPLVIQHEQNGLLIEPGNVDEMTAALCRLLKDATLRDRLAAAGRHTIETCYSFSVRMQKIKAIYDAVLDRNR